MEWMDACTNDARDDGRRRATVMFDALGTTTTEDVRRAYEAKRTCDAVRARAGECADAARGAVGRRVRARGERGGVDERGDERDDERDDECDECDGRDGRDGRDERERGWGRGDGRVTREKLEGGGRGKMVEGVVQPAGMPVVLLEVRGR